MTSRFIVEPPRLMVASRRDQADQPQAERRTRMKLSIVMPAYNEEDTIADAVAGVLREAYPCDVELIIVDDGSVDATGEILRAVNHPTAVVVTHPCNLGKGAALRSGAELATGTHIIPFDADLEYDPADLAAVVAPVIRGRSQVVYGTRLLGVNTRYQSYRHAIGNRALTFAANVLFDVYLSDLHTCMKLLPVELFRELELTEGGFGLDTEITAKLLKCGIRPFEVPISYHSRSFEHGKKITWRDGVDCLLVLTRVRFGNQTKPPRAGYRGERDGLGNSVNRPVGQEPGSTDERSASDLEPPRPTLGDSVNRPAGQGPGSEDERFASVPGPPRRASRAQAALSRRD